MSTLRLGLIVAFFAALFSQPAFSGAGTITTKDASGVTKTFTIVTDGGGNFVAPMVLCDGVAAANCATITAGLALKVDGSAATQPVSGTVTANAGTNLNTSLLALESGGNLATLAGAISASKMQANIAQINGVTPLMGNGVTGTGSPRVTIASDNTAFSVNAVESGTWNIATLTTLSGGGVASGSADSGNPVKVGGKYNAAPVALTDGNRSDWQLSASGSGRFMSGANWGAITTWTTGTALNTNLVLMCGDGAQSILADLQGSGTITTGQISFQFSNDATDCTGNTGTWANLPTGNVFIDQFNLTPGAGQPWTAVTGQSKFTILPQGTRAIRARLTTALTGSGAQVIISPTVIPANTALSGMINPLAANSPNTVIGGVAVSQTTPGTTNGVNLQASASGGCTPSTILSAASNNSTSVKGSAGTLCSVSIINTTATLMDVRFYDTGSAPTCSSATGMVANFVVQANTTSPGMSPNLGPYGMAFASGIGVCITGVNANNDNTNAATGLNLVVATK
jgi:hypothetical protein